MDDDSEGKKQMAWRIVNVKHTHPHTRARALKHELPKGGR